MIHRFVIVAAVAAVSVTLSVSDAVARTDVSKRPYYITAQQMMSVVEEKKDWGRSGVMVTVLKSACEGQGYAQGRFPTQRYHLFHCYLWAKGWIGEYHFDVQADAKHAIYTPTLIGSYPSD